MQLDRPVRQERSSIGSSSEWRGTGKESIVSCKTSRSSRLCRTRLKPREPLHSVPLLRTMTFVAQSAAAILQSSPFAYDWGPNISSAGLMGGRDVEATQSHPGNLSAGLAPCIPIRRRSCKSSQSASHLPRAMHLVLPQLGRFDAVLILLIGFSLASASGVAARLIGNELARSGQTWGSLPALLMPRASPVRLYPSLPLAWPDSSTCSATSRRLKTVTAACSTEGWPCLPASSTAGLLIPPYPRNC
jgi:hypothetical protein